MARTGARGARLVVFCGLAQLAACAAMEPVATCFTILDPELQAATHAPAFRLVGEVNLDGKGLGERIDLPLASPTSLAPAVFRVTDPAGSAACVQLESVIDKASGTNWVTPPAQIADYGPYCVSCPQRVSLGIGGGLYVLPSSDPVPQPATVLEVQPAARDCPTGLAFSSGQSHPAKLRIEVAASSQPADSTPGVLPLEIFISQGSSYFSMSEPLPAELQEAVAEVNVLLAQGLLSARVVRVRRVTLPDPISIERGDYSTLDPVYRTCHDCGSEGMKDSAGLIPIVFAGCLQTRDPIQMRTSVPDGFVARIPDGDLGSSRAHGVYIRGRDCFSQSEPTAWAPKSLGKLLAHELAHYLGLYHSIESDGTTDAIDDTGAANVMNYRPFSVGEAGFTKGQLRVMRRHPSVRY